MPQPSRSVESHVANPAPARPEGTFAGELCGFVFAVLCLSGLVGLAWSASERIPLRTPASQERWVAPDWNWQLVR
jgi:hypothetical protein